jgi:hypothetical protein
MGLFTPAVLRSFAIGFGVTAAILTAHMVSI